MINVLNSPTKRRYGDEPALSYSGHSADCNCSCGLIEIREGQQRYNKRHNSSLNSIASNSPPAPLEMNSAYVSFLHSSNNWRTHDGHQAQPCLSFGSMQYANPNGNFWDLPMTCFNNSWNGNLNPNHFNSAIIYEPVALDNQSPVQDLWVSQIGHFLGPVEGWASDNWTQDIEISNSYDLPDLLPTPLPPMNPSIGENSTILNQSWSPLDQLGNFANGFGNSPLCEFEATNLFVTDGLITVPITPSSSTISREIVSLDSSNKVPKTHDHNPPFTDTLIESNEAQTPTNINWDATFSSSDGGPLSTASFFQVTVKTQPPKKTGKRQGPLNPENAKRAAQIRRQRACWFCWLSKVPCSTEATCHRCSTLQSSLVNSRICIRARLADYTILFFPEKIVAHLQISAVQKVVNDNVSEFSEKPVEIRVTSGQGYPTIKLNVRVFRAQNQEYLAVCRLNTESLTSSLPTGVTLTCYALPLGLLNSDVILLKRNCLEHIKRMISEESGWNLRISEIERGCDMPWRVFKSIERYRRKSTHTNGLDDMLQRATMLYAMHDFMGRTITIADGTGHQAFEHPDMVKELTYSFELTSKVLNRQLKHAMHLLLQETTRDVLDRLEQELRNRAKTKASWAPCFCTILILCICIEELQIAVDGFAVYKSIGQNKTNGFSRASGFEMSRQLDDLLYNDCKIIFHAIQNSRKPKSGLRKQKEVFNPIRDTYDINEKEGVTQAMHDLVGEIHDILGDLGDNVVDRAKAPSVDSEDESLTAHMAFRERNSGRLVSDFLRSFLDNAS